MNIIYVLATIITYEKTIEFIDRWYYKIPAKDLESAKYLAYISTFVYHDKEDEMSAHLI